MLRIVILIIALTAGGGAAWLSYGMIDGESDRSALAPVIPTTDVVVLSSDLPRGSTIGADDLRWGSYPLAAVPSLAIRRDERPSAIAELGRHRPSAHR